MPQLTAPPSFQMSRIESLVKRVALYARVSTKEQMLGYSMECQEEEGLAHIDNNPYLTLFKVYRDPGISGTKSSRPDLNALREDIRSGFVDVVLVTAIDRIGRSQRVLIPWFWMLEEAGVATISLTQNIDTTTSNGKFALSMFIAMAQAEWNAICERTVGGLNAKAKAGGWVCGTPPYGYTLEGRGSRGRSRIVPCQPEVKVLLKAVDYLLIKGYSPNRAAQVLNTDGYLTRSGVPWTGANLKLRILGILDEYVTFRNVEVNKGTPVRIGPDGRPKLGPTQKIPLPAILPQTIRHNLREYFSTRTRPAGNREHLYILTGRITGTCKGHYRGRRRFITGTWMYECEGHGETKSNKGCKAIRAELIENYVWDGVVGILSDRAMLEKAADDWIGTLPVNGDDYRSRITELDKKLAEIERIRTTQLVQYATMGIDPQVVKAAQDEFDRQTKELQSQRTVAQTLLSELEAALDRRTQIVSLAEVSPDQLMHLAPHIQAQVIAMLDLQIQITADPKNVRLAHPCKIEAFFRDNEKLVPDTLTNEQWAMLSTTISELSPKNRKVSLRLVMDAGFHKVRENLRWKQLPASYGQEMSLRAIWLKWMKTDLLERVIAALGEYEGTPVEDRELPEMRITGVLEGTLASMVGQTEVNDVLTGSETATPVAVLAQQVRVEVATDPSASSRW